MCGNTWCLNTGVSVVLIEYDGRILSAVPRLSAIFKKGTESELGKMIKSGFVHTHGATALL